MSFQLQFFFHLLIEPWFFPFYSQSFSNFFLWEEGVRKGVQGKGWVLTINTCFNIESSKILKVNTFPFQFWLQCWICHHMSVHHTIKITFLHKILKTDLVHPQLFSLLDVCVNLTKGNNSTKPPTSPKSFSLN